MTTTPLALNVRKLRHSRRWSQEELATISGVDVRTIQRVEGGRPLSAESIKAIAAAFDTSPDTLEMSGSEITAILAEFEQKYALIDVVPVDRTTDLRAFLGACDAFYFHRANFLTEEQADLAAEFEQDLKDYGDLWRELEPIQRREAEKVLLGELDRARRAGMSVSMGTQTLGLRPQGAGSGKRMRVLYVAIASGTPLRVLVRPKGQISFK